MATKTKRPQLTGYTSEGSRVVIPEGHTPGTTADFLYQCEEAEQAPVKVEEVIHGFPFDVALCFMEVLQETFGWSKPVPTPGFFGPTPPTMVEVQCSPDPNNTRQIFWGEFILPGMDGNLSANMVQDDDHEGRQVFQVGGTIRKRDEDIVKGIVAKTRTKVATSSIYKGQAIKLKTDSRGRLRYNTTPDFLDVSSAKQEELLFSPALHGQVMTNLFTPITQTEQCRQVGVPLKRGVLLEGPYGTGKTQTAYVTAKLCTEHGWTFIMVEEVAALAEALELAAMYSPAVVFAEDIDRAVSGPYRNSSVDGILNTLDGVGTKESEIITILTTNHVNNINKAMLRPGRLDAVLTVTPPDGPTAVKLARQYARGLLDDSNALELAGQEMAGMIPAVIREVVERSKLWAIGRAGGDLSKLALTADDLVGAAQGMQDHLTLLAEEQQGPVDTLESKMLAVIADVTEECVSEKLDAWADRE